VTDQGARVDVPDYGDVPALEILLRGLAGAPVGGDGGKFADDERFDVGVGGFLVQAVGAYVADVGVGEADNLAGVAGIGENFLVAGERGIENDFAATARAGAGGAALKYAPVFERENGFCGWRDQSCVLRMSF
jgi:hypothetical protein